MNIFQRLFEKSLTPGDQLQSYEIKQVIGMGSYGISYTAMDLRSADEVVIKQLRKRKHHQAGLLSYQKEKAILKKMEHPNIPKYIDDFVYNKQYYLIMSRMDGKNLEDLLFVEKKKYSKLESFTIIGKIIEIVAVLHKRGIIHRDLRPPNILLHSNDVSIIDFGLARHKRRKGKLFHSPMKEVHPRSDFYALGHTLLFLLYSNYTPQEKKKSSWDMELDLSKAEKTFIRRLLQIEEPFQSILELQRQLTAIQKNIE